MNIYLIIRSQRTNVDNHFSFLEKILSGVPLGSILSPMIVKIYRQNDLFFHCKIYVLQISLGNTLKAFDKKHYKMKIEHHKEFGNVDYWLKLNRTVLNDTHMEGLVLLLSSV